MLTNDLGEEAVRIYDVENGPTAGLDDDVGVEVLTVLVDTLLDDVPFVSSVVVLISVAPAFKKAPKYVPSG